MTMSHRQHIALRELKEMREQEAKAIRDREAAERAERERPLREAEAALQATATALAKITRENILTQRDDEFIVDDEIADLSMPWSEANKFNREQIEIFKAQNPGSYFSQKNIDTLHDYFERNGLQIVDAKTLEAAWNRLSVYGLLESAPPPEPERSVVEPTYRPVETAPVDPKHKKREQWDRYTLDVVATDPATGKTYTRYQLDRCSAEEYRRVVFGERYTPKISDVIHGMRR